MCYLMVKCLYEVQQLLLTFSEQSQRWVLILYFGFGADIKTAGTASLLISGTLLTQAGEHDRTKVEDAYEPPITCITCS